MPSPQSIAHKPHGAGQGGRLPLAAAECVVFSLEAKPELVSPPEGYRSPAGRLSEALDFGAVWFSYRGEALPAGPGSKDLGDGSGA